MSTREKLVSENDEAYLGPVAMAQFVEAGWIKEWPKVWTPGGRKAVERGYGLWEGTRQALIYVTQPSERGAAYWEGRRG